MRDLGALVLYLEGLGEVQSVHNASGHFLMSRIFSGFNIYIIVFVITVIWLLLLFNRVEIPEDASLLSDKADSELALCLLSCNRFIASIFFIQHEFHGFS